MCIATIKGKCLFCYMDTITVILAGVIRCYRPGLVEHLQPHAFFTIECVSPQCLGL